MNEIEYLILLSSYRELGAEVLDGHMCDSNVLLNRNLHQRPVGPSTIRVFDRLLTKLNQSMYHD